MNTQDFARFRADLVRITGAQPYEIEIVYTPSTGEVAAEIRRGGDVLNLILVDGRWKSVAPPVM